MQKLIDSYLKFLKDNIILKQVGEYTSVTTPFLDRHNDCIQFYIKKDNKGNILITDDGYTIGDLELDGFSFNTPKRKKMLKEILTSYHMELDDNECLVSKTTVDKFPFSKHFFIQGIMSINDLYSVNKTNISSLFVEDVAIFLDKNEIAYSNDVKITGKSGFDHTMNYILPGIKTKKIPERYIQVINSATKSNTENNIFIWNDLQNSRSTENKMFVLINDVENPVKQDLINAYNKYDIETLKWSDKDNIISKLIA